MQVNNVALPTGSASLPKDSTLVKISHATLNPVDSKAAETPLLGRFINRTPGSDFAGTVVATTTSRLEPGDAVFGLTDAPFFGALAEYALVKGRQNVSPLPTGVSPRDASAFGVAGMTAYQSIVPFVKKGDKVFINGGSGGVGTFGIQIAKAIGCDVTVTCSGPNVELCRSLGADEVIDYRTTDVVAHLQRQGTQFALLFDAVGTPAIYHSAHHYLKPEGVFNIVAADPTSFASIRGLMGILLLPRFLGGGQRKIKLIGVQGDLEGSARLAQWVKEGIVKVLVEREYALDEGAEAFARLKQGRTRGKLVIRVAQE